MNKASPQFNLQIQTLFILSPVLHAYSIPPLIPLPFCIVLLQTSFTSSFLPHLYLPLSPPFSDSPFTKCSPRFFSLSVQHMSLKLRIPV